jgi:YesN/AraC family two-component response regulator
MALSTPQEALRTCAGMPADEIDVLLTDVVMPGMSGVDLAERFRAQNPEARVIFMSGYTDDVLVRSGMNPPQIKLLSKPFRLSDLVSKLQEVVISASSGGPGLCNIPETPSEQPVDGSN